MLTISKLRRWSVNYYNRTADEARQSAMDRERAGGGLGEYYLEGDTRAPTWVVVGDTERVAELTGLGGAAIEGGFADTGAAADWLDDGIAPNGVGGRAFTKDSVHGFDLVFAAPKSVSLMRALSPDDVNEKVVANAHAKAVAAAMTYLHEHAGYTRVHNPITGMKDLERLPGLIAIAYQHETSRCGDPHLHTHVVVPNRQARADGVLVSIDGTSLFHEAKAAGMIYQAVLRRELHTERGVEWEPVDLHTGMAEIAGFTKRCLKSWSQQSTRLRQWAADTLEVVDGTPTATQLAAAQKAVRPRKPESLSWAQLREDWQNDPRTLEVDRAAHYAARAARQSVSPTWAELVSPTSGRSSGWSVSPTSGQSVSPTSPGWSVSPAFHLQAEKMGARIDKAAFTRADMVEVIAAQLPVDAAGDPRELTEALVAQVLVRVSAERDTHNREGYVKYTVAAVIAEEERVFEMMDHAEGGSQLSVRPEDLGDLSADQERAIRNIASSTYLVQPLQAPAGAGKTHSLKALRAAAHRAGKEVLVLAPTGKAVDEAMRDQAGDRGLTVAKALKLIQDNTLEVNRATVVVVDEASMVGTPDLKKLLSCAAVGRAKMVLVGDPYQLSPVRARGGMFEQLCEELPWSQRLGEVWRMRNVEERDASLALRSARGNRLRTSVGWYRTHDRLHTGDPVAMAQDATQAYIAAREDGKDVAIICDKWSMADAINRRLHEVYTDAGAPSVLASRDHDIRAGDLIMSRHNDITVEVRPGPQNIPGQQVDQVRNGNRWRAAGIDEGTGRIFAERVTDGARAIFEPDYVREHITLGYAGTVHSAQGITVGSAERYGVCWSIMSENAGRSMAYVAATRAKDENHIAIYQPITGEADHEHANLIADSALHILRRGNKYAAAHYLHKILANDDRPRTMHAEAERSPREQLPDEVAHALDRNGQRRGARREAWRQDKARERAFAEAYERMASRFAGSEQAAERGLSAEVDGLEL